MYGTTQFNVRLPKELIYDLEFISENLKVNRNEWLKVKIAELVSAEKNRIMNNIENKFIGGRISKEDFKKLTGVNPPKELIETKNKCGNATKKYLLSLTK